MTFVFRRAVALAALLGFPLSAASAADALGVVAGSVTSSDGVSVHDAIISLQGEHAAVTSHTDEGGHFEIAGIAAGTYSIRVSAAGFIPLGPRPVNIRSGETTDISLALSRSASSLTTIGHVVASGHESASTSATPVTNIDPQTFAGEGFTRVSEVLQDDISTTLVHPAGGGSTVLPTSVALRGPDPTETLVDVDGHQVNSGDTGDFDLSLLDPADYSDIELVKGISPSSLVGPDTIDGAINIRTLEPTQTPHGLLRLSAGSFNSFAETLQSTGTVGRLGYALSLHGTTNEGEVNESIFDAGTGRAAHVGSGVDGSTALGKLRYAFGSNGGGYAELSFHDQSVTRDLSAALSAFPSPAVTNPTAFTEVDGAEGSSLLAHNAGYGLDVRVPLGATDAVGNEPASLLFRHYTSYVSQSVFGPATQSSPYLYNDRDLIGENSLELDKQFSNGSLTLQYSIRNENLTITGADAGAGDINLESIIVQRPTSAQAFTTTDTSDTVLGQTQRAAVLRYTYDPTATLHLIGATYYSDYSIFGHELDPRFGLVFTPDSRSALRFSIGTTYQSPQLPELYVPAVLPAPIAGVITIGNPNLQPDHATEYGLGLSQVLQTGLHRTDASVDLYRVNLRAPASTFVPPGAADTSCGAVASGGDGTPCQISFPVNAGNGVYQGIELSAQRQLAPFISVRAGYAVRSAYLSSIPPSIQDGTLVLNEQTEGLPLQKATLTFTAAPPRGLQYRAALIYDGQYNELNEPPFVTLDASIGYRWPALELIVSATNLTNVYDGRFTTTNGGVPVAILPSAGGTQPTDAYALQGTAFTISLARRF